MIQVYTGNGKGKTTAAIGLAVRAAGCGKKVYIGQFLKGKIYGELKSLKNIPNIKIEQFGTKCFIKNNPTPEDMALARDNFKKVKKIIRQKKYDLVIMDELNIAVKLGLINLAEIAVIIKDLSKKTELVITGRYAHPEIIKIADLVSEIKEVKHYFKRGVKARRGIEF